MNEHIDVDAGDVLVAVGTISNKHIPEAHCFDFFRPYSNRGPYVQA